MKSGAGVLVGRPSTGKSTLINNFCGAKVCAVSNTPQTTRCSIRGIVTRPEGQLIFIDTPGYHLSERKFNNYMQESLKRNLNEVDFAIYLLDASRRPGTEEETLAGLLKK